MKKESTLGIQDARAVYEHICFTKNMHQEIVRFTQRMRYGKSGLGCLCVLRITKHVLYKATTVLPHLSEKAASDS